MPDLHIASPEPGAKPHPTKNATKAVPGLIREIDAIEVSDA